MNTQEVITSEESEQQNRIARRYAQLIGVMPASFSVAVKELLIDEQNGLEHLSEKSEFQVGRVLRGATALSVLYWASKTFCIDKMPPGWIYSSLQMARFYRPSTLAVLLAYTYLFKRAKRVVKPEEWTYVAEPLQKNIEIASLLSWQLPEIGPTHGLLGGGMLHIAFACFSAHDPKGYAEYRRMLKMKKQLVNFSHEIQTWGCTCVQVASQILLQSGFGVELTHSFIEGFRDPAPLPNSPRAEGAFYLVRCWLEELAGVVQRPAAQGSHTQRNSMSAQTNPNLVELLKVINKQGSLHHWLEKNAEHISADLTPDLLLDGVIFK